MMRRRSTGPTNRFWLFLIGLLTMLAGVVALGLATGRMESLVRAVGLDLPVPGARARVFGSGTVDAALGEVGTAALVGLAGLVLAVLGLGWLIFQLPRRHPVPVFGLHDDARTGLINCDAKVIAGAVRTRVEQLPGLLSCDVTVRGTARHPQVSAELEIDNRSALADVTRSAVRRIASDLASSLDAEVDRIALRVTVGNTTTSSNEAVLTGADPRSDRVAGDRALSGVAG